jgi:hypothetical protein
MAQLKLVRLQDLQAPRIPTPRHQNAHTDWPILHQYHHFAFTSSISKSLLVAQLVQDYFAAKIIHSLCFSDSPWLFERCPSASTWNFHPWCDIAGNSVCSQPGPGPPRRRAKGKIPPWNGHLAMQRAGEEMSRNDDWWWLMIHGMIDDDWWCLWWFIWSVDVFYCCLFFEKGYALVCVKELWSISSLGMIEDEHHDNKRRYDWCE